MGGFLLIRDIVTPAWRERLAFSYFEEEFLIFLSLLANKEISAD